MSNHQTTTTMWSKPVTELQIRYYSKHSPKLKVYGFALTFLQLAHSALAVSAWVQIYEWALRAIPFFSLLTIPLAIISLYVLHELYQKVFETWCYDKLDEDPNTDSSLFLPIACMFILLLSEQQGAKMWLESHVVPATEISDEKLTDASDAKISKAKELYQSQLAGIDLAYAPQLAAATAKFDREIALWKRKQVISDNDARYINQNVAAFIAKKDAAITAINAKKGAEIAVLNATFQANITTISKRDSTLLAVIDGKNAQEQKRFQLEMSTAASSSWFLSVFFVLTIAGLTYARVRINVLSGILPLRTFTDLDTHGGIWEQLTTVFGDIIKRRSVQLTTWLHKKGSPAGAITTIDGTIVVNRGSYNQATNLTSSTLSQTDQTASDYEFLIRCVKDFYAQTDPHKRFSVWSEIYEVRSQLCNRGLGSEISKDKVRIFEMPGITMKWLIDNYPFPPNVVHEKMQAVQTTPTPPQATTQTTTHELTEATQILPITQDNLPDGTELQEDGGILFKQMRSLFKQIADEQGRVIGLKYKGPKSDWTTLGKSEVKSRCGIYERRYHTEASEEVVNGRDMWAWALSRLEANSRISNDNMESINQ